MKPEKEVPDFDELLSCYQPPPIPLIVHRFVSEIKKHKTPFTDILCTASKQERMVYIHVISTSAKFPFEYRRLYPFGFLAGWSTTKAIDIAYEILLGIHYECVKYCLVESRKGQN